MGVGDMFIVFGQLTKTRYDKKNGETVTKTEYFFPAAYNTREEAQAFVDKINHAYHAEIIQMWNPVHKKEMKQYIQ